MKSFLKMFFAAFLAMMVAMTAFAILVFFFFFGMVMSAVGTKQKASVSANSILVLDLSEAIKEQPNTNPLNAFLRRGDIETQGLHEVIRLIHQAANDHRIRGLYMKVGGDPHGLAMDEEIRRALLEFKKSKKFIYAYGETIPQNAYYVASVADKIYLHPQGFLDFRGFASQVMFLKGALDKLEIQPQIFYVGQFKSATEPLRVTQMTEANRIQTKDYLGDLYAHFLEGVGNGRNLDTATLFRFANEGMIRSAPDALKYGLVDGLKYHDEVMESLRQMLGTPRGRDINFISTSKYNKANPSSDSGNSSDKIAVLYAEGDIIGGEAPGGSDAFIASDDYIAQIRKLRDDSSVKAVVLRVNSPGGSALAADGIWRELLLTKQVKPVVVSMGDYAASGGYYISCMADSIFAEANTLTGSIGVFGVIPNLQSFFKNKLGVTFDGVKTAEYADMGSLAQPLTNAEKQFIQSGIDSVYATFIRRVATGRHLSITRVDSIAQGRVWSGTDAVKLGLVDHMGGMGSAIACAARMARLDHYAIREYPQHEATFEKLLGNFTDHIQTRMLKKELGENYSIYHALKRIHNSQGEIKARLPYDILVK